MPRGFRPATGMAPAMRVTDLGKGGRKPTRINQQDMNARAAMREKNAVPSTEEIGNESTTTCALSAGEFTGVPLAEVLKKAGVKSSAVSVRMQGFDRGQRNIQPLCLPSHFPRLVQYRAGAAADVQQPAVFPVRFKAGHDLLEYPENKIGY